MSGLTGVSDQIQVIRGFVITLAVVGALSVHAGAQQPDTRLEREIKAAFLYQFSKYVEWPSAALPRGQNSSFNVCVVADGVFTETVERVLAGETAAGRPMRRLSPETPADARQCQILFIGRDDWAVGQPLLAAVQSTPVLTVSDQPDFLARGGQILLVRDDNRVRFDISLAAVRQSGVTLRSQLLRLARKLLPSPGTLR